MKTMRQAIWINALVTACLLITASPTFAASFGMTPNAASPVTVQPGNSFRVTYSYNVTAHPDFDPDLGILVRIDMKKPGASSSTFRAVTHTGSTCGSRSNAAFDWVIPKPYYDEYGAFDLDVTVSSADKGAFTIGTHVYKTVSHSAAVIIQDDVQYQAELSMTPSVVNLTSPQRFNFEMTIRNTGSSGDSYDIALAGPGWTFHNLPYRPYVQAGQTRTFSCGATPPSDMQTGQTRNAIVTLLSVAKGGQVSQRELRATIRSGFSVENVRAQQIAGTKHIEILYDLVGPADSEADISITATVGGSPVPATDFLPGGAIGPGIMPGNNRRVVWNVGADWDEQLTDRLRIGVTAAGVPFASPSGMVLIPGGTNAGTDPDFGAYSLTMNAFYMDAINVTKAQWDEVYNWAITRGYSFDNAGSGKATDHPVHTVNWYDVIKWCNARSEKEGRTPVYMANGSVYKAGQRSPDLNTSANGYRLPSVTEWEYAARGGISSKRYPWGDLIDHEYANYKANGDQFSFDISPYLTWFFHPTYNDGVKPYTSPAGLFVQNSYGLYDMIGNVWQWCWDLSGSNRHVKGGCWALGAAAARIGTPHSRDPSSATHHVGFRTVRP